MRGTPSSYKQTHEFIFFLTDSMGSDFEEEDEEEDTIKPPLSLGHLATTNGPESVGHLGASELSLQSMSTDSKNNDDSDQVKFNANNFHTKLTEDSFLGFSRWRSRCKGRFTV